MEKKELADVETKIKKLKLKNKYTEITLSIGVVLFLLSLNVFFT